VPTRKSGKEKKKTAGGKNNTIQEKGTTPGLCQKKGGIRGGKKRADMQKGQFQHLKRAK